MRKMTINRIVKFYDTIQYIIVPIYYYNIMFFKKK